MEIKDEFDLEFSLLIREIENYTFANSYDKSVRIRIKNWIKKISQTSNNLEWKKNRNLHAINLLNMLINGRIEEPYNKNPDDGTLQILSKTLVKSKLSYKFWESVKHIYNATKIEKNENKTNYKSPKKPNKLQNSKKNNNKNMYNINNIDIKNYGSYNNININKKDKFKSKRVKTPTMMHRNLSAIEMNNNNKNVFKINNEFIKINIENQSEKELNFLRETAIKLEQELNKNEEIIEAQNEENNALKSKIIKLNEILKTLV